jgi:hypothetical protein
MITHGGTLVIISYRDKRSWTLAEGNRVIAFVGVERMAELLLDQLDAATLALDIDLPGDGWKH